MESDEEQVLEADEGQGDREIASLLGVRDLESQPVTRSVIAHIDLDSFYSAVERERNPDLRGKPLAVVQYNPYGDLRTIKPEEDRKVNDSNGSLIAVSYEARAKGVKRVMRGDEARTACPDLTLIQVPTAHGKADLTIYREAGSKVIDILSRWAICERASIDEAYCDVTEKANALLKDWGADVVERARGTRLAGMEAEAPVLTKEDLRNGSELQTVDSEEAVRGTAWWWARPLQCWTAEERLLTCGAAVVNDMRGAVQQELGYTCSAGIASNKLLAKLSSGMNKPSAQTLVLPEKIRDLLAPLPISRIKGLGGDLGAKVQADLNVTTISDLWAAPMTRLEQLYGPSTAQWVWRICRGLDDDTVEDRKLPKSLSCGKTFYARNNLRSLDEVKKWLFQLSGELTERLQMDARSHSRLPQLLNVSFQSSVAQQGPKPAHKNAKTLNRDPNRWPPSQQVSRSHALHLSAEGVELPGKETQESLTELSFSLVKKWHTQQQSVGSAPLCLTTLFIGCSNFLPITQKSGIRDFFKASSSVPSPPVDKPVDSTSKSPEGPGPAEEGSKARKGSPMPFTIRLPPPTTDSASSASGVQEPSAGAGPSKDPWPTAAETRRPSPPLPHHPSDKSRQSLPLSSLNKRKRGGLDKYLTKAQDTDGGEEGSHVGTTQAASPMNNSSRDVASSGMQGAPQAVERGDPQSSINAVGSAHPMSGSSSSSSRHAMGATADRGVHAGVDVRDVDESVLAELPPVIRAEIEAAMRQANGGGMGGTGKKAKKKGTLESFFGRKG